MNTVCMKCNEWMSPVEEIYATSCGHLFHEKCMTDWFNHGSETCPCCPDKLSSMNIFLLRPTVPNVTDKQEQSLIHSYLDASQALVSYQKHLFKQRDEEFKALKTKNKQQEDAVNEYKTKTEELVQNNVALKIKIAEDELLHQEQIEDFQRIINAQKEDLEKKELIMSALALSNKTQNERIEKLKKANQTLQENVESLNGQCKEGTKSLLDREVTIKQLTDKIDKLTEDNQKLTNNNATLKENILQLEGELSTANEKLARRDVILAARTVVNQDQINIIGRDDSKMNELKNDLERLRKELAPLLSDMSNTKRKPTQTVEDDGSGETSSPVSDDSNGEDDEETKGYFNA